MIVRFVTASADIPHQFSPPLAGDLPKVASQPSLIVSCPDSLISSPAADSLIPANSQQPERMSSSSTSEHRNNFLVIIS